MSKKITMVSVLLLSVTANACIKSLSAKDEIKDSEACLCNLSFLPVSYDSLASITFFTTNLGLIDPQTKEAPFKNDNSTNMDSTIDPTQTSQNVHYPTPPSSMSMSTVITLGVSALAEILVATALLKVTKTKVGRKIQLLTCAKILSESLIVRGK